MITDFLSNIQFLATVTLGFVFLGHTNYFTSMLHEKIFLITRLIDGVKKECYDIIPDKTTLENLKPADIGGGNTQVLIEQLKIKYEKIQQDICRFEEKCKDNLQEKSKLISISSLSLFIFLICLILLFAIPIRSLPCNLFIISVSILSALYIFLCCCFGERERKCLSKIFNSHKISFFVVVGIIILSIIISVLGHSKNESITMCFVFLFLTFGWGIFLFYSLKLWYMVKKFRNELNENKEPLLKQCREINDDYNRLQTVSDVADNILSIR